MGMFKKKRKIYEPKISDLKGAYLEGKLVGVPIDVTVSDMDTLAALTRLARKGLIGDSVVDEARERIFAKYDARLDTSKTGFTLKVDYDHAKEGDLAADGDVAGLYELMRKHPKARPDKYTDFNYEDIFHIAERVAEAVLNERLKEELWGFHEQIEDEVAYRTDEAIRALAREHEFVIGQMIHDEVKFQLEGDNEEVDDER